MTETQRSGTLSNENLDYLFLYYRLPFAYQIQTKQIRSDIYYPYKMSFKEKLLAFFPKAENKLKVSAFP